MRKAVVLWKIVSFYTRVIIRETKKEIYEELQSNPIFYPFISR